MKMILNTSSFFKFNGGCILAVQEFLNSQESLTDGEFPIDFSLPAVCLRGWVLTMVRTLQFLAVIAITMACNRPALLDMSAAFPRLNGNQADPENAFRLEQATSPHLILNFFAPDCPPCITELPELKKFYEATQAEGKIVYIAIGSALDSVAQGESVTHELAATTVAPFVKQYNLSYPVYLADTSALRSWNITGFPETFIFSRDRKGKWQLKRKFISAVTAAQLQAAIEEPESSLY